MDKDALKKKKKSYGWGVVLTIVALYFVGQAGTLMAGQGGTDNVSATILVLLKSVLAFGLIFCIVMWFITGRKLKKNT